MYTARFRRAKRLQLGRQVMFEILHGGRIHRQVREGLPWWFSLGGENDRGCSGGNPSQRPETLWWTADESDDGDPDVSSGRFGGVNCVEQLTRWE